MEFTIGVILSIGVLALIIYMMVYAIVDRICKCKESCTAYSAITKLEAEEIKKKLEALEKHAN